MVIKMKLNFTAVGFVLLSTSFAVLASPTSGSAQAQQRAISDRVKTEAERLASEGRSATARYDSPDAGSLKIYSPEIFLPPKLLRALLQQVLLVAAAFKLWLQARFHLLRLSLRS